MGQRLEIAPSGRAADRPPTRTKHDPGGRAASTEVDDQPAAPQARILFASVRQTQNFDAHTQRIDNLDPTLSAAEAGGIITPT